MAGRGSSASVRRCGRNPQGWTVAWLIANLYLCNIGADPISDEAPPTVGFTRSAEQKLRHHRPQGNRWREDIFVGLAKFDLLFLEDGGNQLSIKNFRQRQIIELKERAFENAEAFSRTY